MSDKLTDADLVARLRAVEEHGTVAKAAIELGIAKRNLQTSLASARAKGLSANTIIRDPMEKMKLENQQLKRQLDEVQRDNDTAASIREAIYGLSVQTPEPPRWLNKRLPADSPGTPMMIWSDWHWGETVRPEEVGGINEFNSKIAAKRLERLVENSTHLILPHIKGSADGIVICLGGDMITGDIHQELQDTNDAYVQESLLDLQEKLIAALTYMADTFGKVFVPCVVGNHGRMTHKPRMKGRVFTSFEWNLYNQLELYFKAKGDRRVQFFIPDQTDAYFKVNGHRFLLTHGDSMGVRGGDGIIGAIGPIMRGSFKVGRSEAQIGRNFDTILMGHWHQYISTRGLIVNNCLKGYDEFARIGLRAPATPASQALWFVHKKWGINTQMEVFVQDPIEPPKSKAWVEVFNER